MSNSKTTESNLWKWLATSRQIYRDRLHINRVENTVLRGMPDVEGCIDGQQFWIELKCAGRPTNPGKGIAVEFQPNQAPWIERRMAAGGKVHILLQVGSRRRSARYLIDGRYARTLSHGVTEYQIGNRSVCCDTPQAVIGAIL